MDRAAFESTLAREGFEIVSVTMRPEAINAEHTHGFDARVMVVDGAMTVAREDGPARTFQVGEWFDLPSGCRHSETAGAAGATYVAGRRKPGETKMNQSEFEADLKREGFQVYYGGLKANESNTEHAHDWHARVMVIGGEITITRNGKADRFGVGDSCSVAAGELHAENVGPHGVAYISGRRAV